MVPPNSFNDGDSSEDCNKISNANRNQRLFSNTYWSYDLVRVISRGKLFDEWSGWNNHFVLVLIFFGLLVIFFFGLETISGLNLLLLLRRSRLGRGRIAINSSLSLTAGLRGGWSWG